MVFLWSLSDNKSPQVSRSPQYSEFGLYYSVVSWDCKVQNSASSFSTKVKHFRFISILHQVFTLNLGKVVIIFSSMYSGFFYLFWMILFHSHWQFASKEMSRYAESIFFVCVSYRLEHPDILLMYLSVPFWIIPKSSITIMVVVLRCHICSISVHLFDYSLWRICYYLLALTYQLDGMFFLL